MSEFPKSNHEQKEVVDDNDRKFTLGAIDPEYLNEHKAKSYKLTTDWLETNESDETKVVCKDFDDGKIQILLITKVTVAGNRIAEKKEISEDEYSKYLKHSKVHIEKMRYELDINQGSAKFKAKYDLFTDSSLRVLEVGPDTSGQNMPFKPEDFEYQLEDVSEDISFSGFRVAAHI